MTQPDQTTPIPVSGSETGPQKGVRVYCSQWAQCGWKGRRRTEITGAQPDPCPRCGGMVVR